MMRLLGVGPIDIISTTIMTTTLNGSLPASSDCIAPSRAARGGSGGMRHGPWHKRRPAVTSVPPPAGHHSALSGEELLPSVATWPHESDHDSTLGRGVGLAAPLAGQRSERPQKNKAHGGPVAPAQFSTEMALNDLESIGESIVMVENGFVR